MSRRNTLVMLLLAVCWAAVLASCDENGQGAAAESAATAGEAAGKAPAEKPPVLADWPAQIEAEKTQGIIGDLLKKMPPALSVGDALVRPGEKAKLIIKLINAVADLVNNDPDVSGRLKVAFFPDYNVKNAQPVYPAADVSEQISLAGKEASGTGNMKFSLNGALTIGTLDGANVEIRQEVGEGNFFLFGLTAEQARNLKESGYRPRNYYEDDATLREVLDFIASGALAGGDKSLFRPLVDNLLESDPFLVLADYQSYVECQAQISTLWRDPQDWTRTSILNDARMGKFSSDRSIREYCRDVWRVQPMHVKMEAIEPYAQAERAIE